MNTEHSSETGLEIAIIGMAGRFPGADNLQQFWQNLEAGVESVRSLSPDELRQLNPEDLQHPDYVKVEGVFNQLDEFDADFFGYSPREAEILDPQQRWFLELAWTALEDAGYDAAQYDGDVGVFAGAAANTYLLNLYSNPAVRSAVTPYQMMIANDKDFLTSRVAYKLNLTGPSVTVQTACSSSLVAVHLAAQSLLSGECDMALAGGVSLSEPTGYRYQSGGIYSPDGHCRAFDVMAQGTVAGSGLGVIVLKRLADARSDGDSVYAIIKGSAINNDGANKISYTAPSIDQQTAVIRSAQLAAGIEPRDISYIEAHGTGTAMGDPIEVTALTQAFQSARSSEAFCGLGSLKPNIGHLDAAAGIAGLIKTVLALQHRQLPPSLNIHQPQAQIDRSPFYLVRTLQDWTAAFPRAAGVSSFGIGGTNAHVVLQEAPLPVISSSNHHIAQLFPISAKTAIALVKVAENLSRSLKQMAANTTLNLADIAHTLQTGRQPMAHRQVIMASTFDELLDRLDQLTISAPIPATTPTIALLFPGQGSQYPAMAQWLYECSSEFRLIFDRGCALLADRFDLRAIVYDTNNAANIAQTKIAQPTIFLVEYALAQTLMTIGVKPQAYLGHSNGEYVAATLAGVFTFEVALLLVADRAAWMQACPSGAMLSVALSPEALQSWLNADRVLSVQNAPELCVVSGSEAAIADLATELQAKAISCRRLQTSHGFHSNLMQAAAEPLRSRLQTLTLQSPQQPWLSNLTGDWITPEQATSADYWVAHMLQPVQMAKGLSQLIQANYMAIEVGAGTAMTTLFQTVARSLGHSDRVALPTLRHPQAQPNTDRTVWLQSIAALWRVGIPINWSLLPAMSPATLRRLHLPTYPFERQRYWIEANRANNWIEPLPPAREITADRPTDYGLCIPTWVRSSLPNKFADLPAQISRTYRRWLILGNTSALTEQTIDRLQDHGQDVIRVEPGDQFAQIGYRQFSVRPSNLDDWQELFADLALRELLPDQLIDLWNLDDRTQDFTAQFWSVINMVRSLVSHNAAAKLLLVSDQSQAVLGNEPIDPVQAMLPTLGNVIRQEFPDFGVTCLDVDGAPTAASIISESLQIETPNVVSAIVAHRGTYRWHQEYTAIIPPENSVEIAADRNYVVIGDFVSGLGPTWLQWLKQQGAKVAVIDHVMTDAATLTAELEQITRTQGPISGIFYSTPMSHDDCTETIIALQSKHWESVLADKITGLQILIAAIADRPIPFCCVQSSLSSVLGGFGLAAYASANAAIDGMLAVQRQSMGVTAWYSVNWDAHGDQSSSEAESLARSPSALKFAIGALSDQSVQQATQQVLQFSGGAQIVVATGDLQRRLDQWIGPRQPAPTQDQNHHSSDATTANRHNRPSLTSAYIAPRDAVEQSITAIWEELLGIQPIGVDDSFFDLGGHSLLAVQAISRIRDRFGVDLSMRQLLFESPTIAGIATVIAANLPLSASIDTAAIDAVQAMLDEIQNLSPEALELALEGAVSNQSSG